MTRWNPGDSQGSGNALCDTVTVDTGRSILSKPTECTTPRLTPNVHCRYWVMVTDVPLCWGCCWWRRLRVQGAGVRRNSVLSSVLL